MLPPCRKLAVAPHCPQDKEYSRPLVRWILPTSPASWLSNICLGKSGHLPRLALLVGMITPPYSDVDEGGDAYEVPRRVRCAWLAFSKPFCPTTSSEPEAGAESVMCEMVSAFSQAGQRLSFWRASSEVISAIRIHLFEKF